MQVGDWVLYKEKVWEVITQGDSYWELSRDIIGRSGMPIMRTYRRVQEKDVVPITKEVVDIMRENHE